jgi:hypothetical protein
VFSFLGDVLQGMKMLYRAPLDYLEEVTTGMADTVFVNSGFTKEVTVVFLLTGMSWFQILLYQILDPSFR